MSGTINPGPDAAPLSGVTVDVANWSIRIEADAKGADGKPVHISAEGKLEDLGSPHRRITGTWQQGAVKGDFRIVRD